MPVGRYCYWYDPQAPAGPEEPERVARARRRLLATLDSAADADPTDDLVAGQRVRYWLEAAATDTALAAARACAGTPWWCAALRGWVLHESGDAAAAGAVFDSALAAMPEPERCAWSDVSLLLENEVRDRYERLECGARADLEHRFWWLATPFFSRGGNDRRNEHFARRTLAHLARQSPTAYESRWGDDMEELLLRYGWAERWSRRESAPGVQQHSVSVIGHESAPTHRWTSDARLLDAPYAATSTDWEPDAPDARERFATPSARLLSDLDAASSVFLRGDSMLVVTTFAWPSVERLSSASSSVVLAREDVAPTVTPALEDSTGGVALTIVPGEPHLVSIELLADSGLAARARYALSPPARAAGVVALSDLLPFRPEGDADVTFEDAARLALRGSRVVAPARLGVYWELHGLGAGRHPLEMSLSMVAEREGWLTRAWRRLSGRSRAAPPDLRWADLPLVTGDRVGRSVMIELPALEPGRYELQLCARGSGAARACAVRALTIVR
ncbi:MAG TPA: hypothetical protein VGE02_06115 [Gemmatimonadales bacterium]